MLKLKLLLFILLPLAVVAQDKNLGEGFFKSLYKQQLSESSTQKIENINYGTFKSNSGWKDTKYYLLMNNVLPGTIVKIKCSQTDRIVYAKVLGSLMQTKENEGFVIRMSNATLEALALTSNTASLELTWNN